jgi:hypothetical protein
MPYQSEFIMAHKLEHQLETSKLPTICSLHKSENLFCGENTICVERISKYVAYSLVSCCTDYPSITSVIIYDSVLLYLMNGL